MPQNNKLNDSDFAATPGTLIIGESEVDRTALLLKTIAADFTNDATATLFFFGTDSSVAALRELLPKERVASEIVPLRDVAQQHKATLISFGTQTSQRAHAWQHILSAIQVALDRAERSPFILAFDYILPFVPAGHENSFLVPLRKGLAAQAIMPIITIRSAEEIAQRFCSDQYFFMRFERNYILRSDMNIGYLVLVAHPSLYPAPEELPDGNANSLPEGGAVVLIQTQESCYANLEYIGLTGEHTILSKDGWTSVKR